MNRIDSQAEILSIIEDASEEIELISPTQKSQAEALSLETRGLMDQTNIAPDLALGAIARGHKKGVAIKSN